MFSSLAVSVPQASAFIIRCGSANRSDPQVSDTSGRCLFPNFTQTQLLGYWTPATSASLACSEVSFQRFQRHFILPGWLLPSSIQPAFILPGLAALGIRSGACWCYQFHHHAKMSRDTGEILTALQNQGEVLSISSLVQDLLYWAMGLFFASLWKDELKATDIFQGHTDPLAIMKRYYLGLNSSQEILPAVLLSKQLPKHLPISFAISDNIFIQKSYRTSSTCSFESSMFYLLFLFVLFQSLWNRNWSATGNSFQHNIVPRSNTGISAM